LDWLAARVRAEIALMFAACPWRDVDAYIQVARPPGAGTILQYGLIYPWVAQIPLFGEDRIEEVRRTNLYWS
jgi:hypothetical protein